MGKVRNHIEENTAGLAQWINRKLGNHHPLSEREPKLGLAERKANMNGRDRVNHVEGTTEVTYVLSDGSEYLIQVTELNGPR